MLHVVFFGTHEFAATILEGLLLTPFLSVDLVVTQPDRPVGRKQGLEKPPVKIVAERHGIPILQPLSLKNFEFQSLHPSETSPYPLLQGEEQFKEDQKNFAKQNFSDLPYNSSPLRPARSATSVAGGGGQPASAKPKGGDRGGVSKGPALAIVAQYGLLIPKKILETFPLGILNVHPSLLPKYRGATPIQSAIMNGDTDTGTTIMKLDEGMDTGPILLQKKLSIGSDETYHGLEKKLAAISIEALTTAIPQYVAGTLTPQPQDNAQATYTKQLTRDDGHIDWRRSASDIYNQYRALTPWPGIWTTWNEKRLKLLKIKPSSTQYPAGTVHIENDRLFVGCGGGSIETLELQLEGKMPMHAKVFINGLANTTLIPHVA